MEKLFLNFDALRNLHDCANTLLSSPLTQQALVDHRHEKCVEEVSEGSLRMLDVCGITRDVLLLVKEHVQDLQSAIRRRSIGKRGHKTRIGAYRSSNEKITKEMFNCLHGLKAMENNCAPSLLSDIDDNLVAVVTVLRELRMTTVSVVESILSFTSISKPKQKSRRRSFFLNCMRGKRVANASEENGMNELEGVDTAIYSFQEQNLVLKSKVDGAQTANTQLETLEVSIGGLEVELECMFRRLIQTRVSLLNILNN